MSEVQQPAIEESFAEAYETAAESASEADYAKADLLSDVTQIYFNEIGHKRRRARA
jgi:hypothetical protein